MRAGGRAQRVGVAVAVGVRWVRAGRLPSWTRTQIHPLPRAAGGWALTSWLTWSQTLQAVLTRPAEEGTEAQPESPGEIATGPGGGGWGGGVLFLPVGRKLQRLQCSWSACRGDWQRNRNRSGTVALEASGTQPPPSPASEPTGSCLVWVLSLRRDTAFPHTPSSPGRHLLVLSPTQSQSQSQSHCSPRRTEGDPLRVQEALPRKSNR